LNHSIIIIIIIIIIIVGRPCPKNDRRKITQNSIEVDAETKDSTRKTEEKLDGRYMEGQWEDRKQWNLGVGQRRTTF